MDYITVEKKANCYTIEINASYRVHDSEDEIFFYKTKEEMLADIANVIERAHVKKAEEEAILNAKKESE